MEATRRSPESVARTPAVIAVFAGDGVLRNDLVSLADRAGVGERVRFLGFVNQSGLPATYRGADCLVLPSQYEHFGLVVNEAFASGVPAIVSDACGAVGDLVQHGVTGLTYRSGDVATLAAHLGDLARIGNAEGLARARTRAHRALGHRGERAVLRGAMVTVSGPAS